MALHIALCESETYYEPSEVYSPTNPGGFKINYARAEVGEVNDRPMWVVYDLVDEDVDFLKDILFEDHDVLMLFEMDRDGFQNNNPSMGYANLNPKDWFTPFRKEG